MSAAESFLVAIFLMLALGAIVAHFVDRRRQRSVDEFKRQHRERREEVERQARKSL